MKRLCSILALAVIIATTLTLTAFAETDGAGGVADTVLTRIFEWWEINKTEILAATSGIGAAIGYLAIYFKNKKPFENLTALARTSDKNTSNLVEAYNNLAEEYNRQSAEFTNLKEELARIEGYVLNVENIEHHLAKVLSMVYTGSALPNGVKDMVNVECAQAITIAKGDLGVEVEIYDEKGEGDNL